MVSATSSVLLTSLYAVNESVASNTTLFPCMNSRDDPWGIGTFFSTLISSVDALVIPIATLIPLPEVLASVTPITTVVVDEGTTYTFDVVKPTFALVFNLKVFAIWFNYPRAIAIATASLRAVSEMLTPLTLTSVWLFIAPATSNI